MMIQVNPIINITVLTITRALYQPYITTFCALKAFSPWGLLSKTLQA
jgi:hypothetical protein